MCLVELRNRRLPWQGGPTRVDTTAVPFKVTRNERPIWQLPKARNGETKMDFLNGLIMKCWDQTPGRRPDFKQIAEQVGAQYHASMRRSRDMGAE